MSDSIETKSNSSETKSELKAQEKSDDFYNREMESIAQYLLDTFVKSNDDTIDVEKHFSSLYDTLETLRDNAEILLDMYCDQQKEAGKKIIYPAGDPDNDDEDSSDESDCDEHTSDVNPLPEAYESVSRAYTDDAWSNEPPNSCKGCGESCYFAHEYCKRCYYSNAVKPVYYRSRR